MTAWVDEDYRSWRWMKRFAWRPIKTLDQGWIIGRFYWRWRAISGWGFNDNNWAYAECSCPGCRDDLPWIKGYHSTSPDGMFKCLS